MLITDSLSIFSNQSPDKVAISFQGNSMSYKELEKSSNQVAHYIMERDLKKGARIGILMPNCLENVLSFLGVIKAGFVEVNFNPETPLGVIIQSFQSCAISGLILHDIEESMIEKIVSSVSTIEFIICEFSCKSVQVSSFDEIFTMDNIEVPVVEIYDTDYAMIQYTSGTTGIPKGAILTHKNFISATLYRKRILKVESTWKSFLPLPLSHSCAKSILVDSLCCGGTAVLAAGFLYPQKLIEILLREKITHIVGPPFLFTILAKIKNNIQILSKLRLHLSVMEIGLSYVSKDLINILRSVFPWVLLINRYGLTENAGAVCLNCFPPGKRPYRVTSCGRETDITKVTIVSRSGKPQEDGSEGTILMHGDNVMAGYWENICKGYKNSTYQGFLTDDLGIKDKNGFIYITGRKNDIIKVSGEKISSLEIEKELSQIDGIEETAIIGCPCAKLGERIIAHIILDKNTSLTAREIINCCKKNLSPYMVPHEVIIHTYLPRNTSGKIDKLKLRQFQFE